jgi:hypothetical protein
MIDRTIVAAPVADAHYLSVRSFNDLPSPHRAAIQRLIEPPALVRWLDANSAQELIHLARQRARLAQVEEHEHERVKPAWESDSSRSLIDRLARETDLHTQAEAALFLIPYRFQKYLRLCLDPDERILFWVHRPRFTVNRVMGISVFGKLLREGLLLLTDRQILWIMDAVTPTVAVEGYGYVAQSIASDLLSEVTIEEKPRHLKLRLKSENALRACDDLEIEFQFAAREELEQATHLLASFIPRENDRRLRRITKLNPNPIPLDDPMESDRAQTRAIVEELQHILAEKLECETIYAQALVPTGPNGGAKLLTVTDRNVYLTTNRVQASAQQVCAYALGDVVSNQFCFSVMGSWLQLRLVEDKLLEIAFPLTALKWFNACWLILRKLSSNVAPQDNSRLLARRTQC